MKFCEKIKKITDNGCSIYNVKMIISTELKECLSLDVLSNGDIILYNTYDGEISIDDFGDIYLSILKYNHPFIVSIVGKISYNSKEYIFRDILTDDKNHSITFI